MAGLTRYESDGVFLVGDVARPFGITLAFTERTGGCSKGPYASLNLGDACGDDPALVGENRARALGAIGARHLADRLVCPRQVHGSHVVRVTSGRGPEFEAARREAREGADAIVCTTPGVPVLMCFADCVPVILAAPGGFAVCHSGWRGTVARVCARAVAVLAESLDIAPREVGAYIGPRISARDYEVSPELAARFEAGFGPAAVPVPNHVDLGFAVALTLREAGLEEGRIVDSALSTAGEAGRFFSYRASGGTTGRHGALAWMAPGPDGVCEGAS